MNFIFFEFYNFIIFIFFIFYKMPYKYNIIEAKHKYQMIDTNCYLNNANNIYDDHCVKSFKLEWPSVGSNDYNRIGNKINNVSLRVEYNFQPLDYRFHLLPSTLSTSGDPNYFMKFRMMVIDIPDEDTLSVAQAFEYFSELFVYTNNDLFYQSNQTKSLRVTGKYTGMFNILYDEPIIINSKHPQHHKVFNIKLKDTIEFNPQIDTRPQNHNYFIWFIMPKLYYTDVSPAIREQIGTLHNYPIDFRANIKLTWFDN